MTAQMVKIRHAIRIALIAAISGGLVLNIAYAEPLRWKMASWFPPNLTQLGTLGLRLTESIDRVSGGEFSIEYFGPGALIAAKDCFDTVSAGTIDACWSSARYWYGKEPALAMFAAVPFGPRAAEFGAWIYFGGGIELMDKIYAEHGLKSLPCGVVAPEASGWFRKEIKSVEDLKGLKMRFFGLGARVMERLGVVTQLIAGDDIVAAMARGSIDAAEYSMPAIDLELGIHDVAKHYYFPGWHQQATLFELLMNKQQWEALNDTQRAQLELVCGDNFRHGLVEGEAIQSAALATLKSKGVVFHLWPPEILDIIEQTWIEVATEDAGRDDNFKKVWESYTQFRVANRLWKDLGHLR